MERREESGILKRIKEKSTGILKNLKEDSVAKSPCKPVDCCNPPVLKYTRG